MSLFKRDLSEDQISGWLGVLRPDRKEKQAALLWIFAALCTTKIPIIWLLRTLVRWQFVRQEIAG
jgi:uncharacterized Tic20 family protein